MVGKRSIQFIKKRIEIHQPGQDTILENPHGIRVIHRDSQRTPEIRKGPDMVRVPVFHGLLPNRSRCFRRGGEGLPGNDTFDFPDPRVAADGNGPFPAHLESIPLPGVVGRGDHDARISPQRSVGKIRQGGRREAHVDDVHSLERQALGQATKKRI